MRRSSSEKVLRPLNNPDLAYVMAWWWRRERGDIGLFYASLVFAGMIDDRLPVFLQLLAHSIVDRH